MKWTIASQRLTAIVLFLDSSLRIAEYFAPYAILTFSSSPIFGVIPVQSLLLALLLAEKAPKFYQESQQASHLFVAAGAVLFVVYSGEMRFIGLIILSLMLGFYGICFLGVSISKSISQAFRFIIVVTLLNYVVLLATQLSPFTELLLVLLGLYYLLQYIGSGEGIPEAGKYDLNEIYVSSTSDLLQTHSGTGAAVVCLTCMAVFLTTSREILLMLLAVFIPNLLGMLAGDIFLTLTIFAHIFFTIYLVVYWTKVLVRAPQVLDLSETSDQPLSSPLVGTTIIPTVGYMVSRIPHQGSIFLVFHASSVEVLGLTFVLAGSLLYSLALFDFTQQFTPLTNFREWKPKSIQIELSEMGIVAVSYICMIFYVCFVQGLSVITVFILLLIGLAPFFYRKSQHFVIKSFYMVLCASIVFLLVPKGNSQLTETVYSSIISTYNLLLLYLAGDLPHFLKRLG